VSEWQRANAAFDLNNESFSFDRYSLSHRVRSPVALVRSLEPAAHPRVESQEPAIHGDLLAASAGTATDGDPHNISY